MKNDDGKIDAFFERMFDYVEKHVADGHPLQLVYGSYLCGAMTVANMYSTQLVPALNIAAEIGEAHFPDERRH